ncbi:hypothetical protein KRR55_10275 [Paeniglutamicibacter sp. ABSL32-1]|uniref:hypothetical protein n=1 Tax=Paeniglutamicibacter quisquiliarum TaxID=2849498 RepID=UPI001C2CFA62|nr:hypothetical protein [Paeniglutamicibacter quisquiliarum]MBV1779495.1 hypothetical protein [Paeniglutamicibacter quisquiliarum]
MPYIEALVPTIVVALVFWFVIRAVSNVDRSERAAEAKVDEQIKLAEQRKDNKSPKADN